MEVMAILVKQKYMQLNTFSVLNDTLENDFCELVLKISIKFC